MEIKEIVYEWREDDPIFSSATYLKLLSNEFGWFGGFEKGKLSLVVAYTIKKKYIFRYAQFQSEVICVSDDVSEAAEKSFLNSVVTHLNKLGVDFCVQPSPHIVFRTCPDNSISAPFGSYFVDLEKTEDELWAGIHTKHRNVIRNAQKKGVDVRFGYPDAAAVAHKIMLQTMQRSNMPFADWEAFSKMIDALGDNVQLITAYLDGVPQGCAVMPFSKHGAYYLYGGSIDSPVLGAMNLLHWEAMKFFKARGVKYYDFVGARISPVPGSKLEGIQRFKSRFGATMRTGYLWKMAFNYKYYLYYFLLKQKTGSMGDIIDQERKYIKKNSSDV